MYVRGCTLPSPDPLQRALAGGDRPLVWLGLGATEAPQVHVHEGRPGGGVGGGQRGEARIRAAVVVIATAVRRVVVRVRRVPVIAVGARPVRGVVALCAPQTRLSVPYQDRHRDPSGWWRRSVMVVRLSGQLQGLVLPLPLALVAAVLEPDLHLRGGEFEAGGQVLSLRGRQVALLLEASLQLEHLGLGEQHSGLPPGPLLLHRAL